MELRGCPFCGAGEEQYDIVWSISDYSEYYVVCVICGAKGPVAANGGDALERWNKRNLDTGLMTFKY